MRSCGMGRSHHRWVRGRGLQPNFHGKDCIEEEKEKMQAWMGLESYGFPWESVRRKGGVWSRGRGADS